MSKEQTTTQQTATARHAHGRRAYVGALKTLLERHPDLTLSVAETADNGGSLSL